MANVQGCAWGDMCPLGLKSAGQMVHGEKGAEGKGRDIMCMIPGCRKMNYAASKYPPCLFAISRKDLQMDGMQ